MKRNVLSLLFFTFFTLILTYPLLFKIDKSVLCIEEPMESLATIWNFWWYKFTFINKIPFHNVTLLAYPFGINVHHYGVMLPLSEFFYRFVGINLSPIVAFNFLIILSFILSGFFMYLLVYSITKHFYSSLLAGAIYTFSPYHLVHAWQHLSLAQLQWIPLYVYFFLKLRRNYSLKVTIFCITSFILVFYFDYHYGFFVSMLTAIFLLYELFFSGKKLNSFLITLKNTKFLIFFLTLFLLFNYCLFIYRSTHIQAAQGWGLNFRDIKEISTQTARLLSYIIPPYHHPILGGAARILMGSTLYGYIISEHTLYLGFLPLILGFLAFRRRKRFREYKFIIELCIFCFVFFLICSLHPYFSISRITFLFPSYFLFKVFPHIRAYVRFGILVIFSLSILGGLGFYFMVKERRKNITRLFFYLIFAFVIFEFGFFPPQSIYTFRIPQVYYWLKDVPDNIVVAEYPLDVESPNEFYRFYQTIHHKPLINGTLPGTYPNRVAKSLFKLSEHATVSVLSWMGVRYVLVHQDDYLKTELVEWIDELNKIEKNPGLKLVKNFPSQEVGQIDVYEVVAEPLLPKEEVYKDIETSIYKQ